MECQRFNHQELFLTEFFSDKSDVGQLGIGNGACFVENHGIHLVKILDYCCVSQVKTFPAKLAHGTSESERNR